MVEITYQMVLSTLQTIALIVGIAYYLLIMRNSQRNQALALKAQEQALETRQAQLYMNMYNQYLQRPNIKAADNVLHMEFDGIEEFEEKYGR